MSIDFEPSLVTLAIQAMGISLVAVLSLLLSRSVERRFLVYWTLSWCCLALALFALLAAFCIHGIAHVGFALYFFGEYVAGYLLLVGCRCYADGTEPRRRDAWLLVPAAGLALTLPCLSDNFNIFSLPHIPLLMGFWIASYLALAPARRRTRPALGLQVLSVALLLLPLCFSQYLVTQVYHLVSGQLVPFPHMKYSSLYDLILEILLAFGAVMVVMESVHDELRVAHARLRAQAEQDALTEALNRHAFKTLVEQRPPAAGSVALVDINEFKAINDTLGHAAGDAAIRAVAQALRGVIRADDLLFRWGGDEFLLVLPNVSPTETTARLERVKAMLASTTLPGLDRPLAVAISCGIACLATAPQLQDAIEQADQAMYRQKHAQRTQAVALLAPRLTPAAECRPA